MHKPLHAVVSHLQNALSASMLCALSSADRGHMHQRGAEIGPQTLQNLVRGADVSRLSLQN